MGNEPPAPGAHASQEKLFRDLVAQHGERLQAFVMRHIGHPDEAADIAQQAFVEAAAAISRFRGDSQLSTWLYGIAMNLVRNYLSRAPQRVHRFESDETLAEMPGGEAGPDEQLDRNRALARLTKELETLPAEMREVLLLVAVDELSYEEAATLLAIPVGTVRSRVFRARAALKDRMGSAVAVL
ncbi:MAG TPA: RNA polymerase sigma factor [Usitatibacter sp.]|nr:RNA polymerase sigma factor [Usitatibacter sp.]